MSLIPRSSFRNLDSIFDEAFPTAWRFLPESGANASHLAVDIKEKGDKYVVKADFPGIKKDDIDITIDNGVLTISAEYKDEKEEKEEGRVVRQERRFGKFSRSFSLGEGIDEESVQANFDNGVLTVTIPKPRQPEVKSRKVSIS